MTSSSSALEQPAANQIGGAARSGVIWSFLQMTGLRLIGLAVTAVIARHLTAADYGLFGMVATLTALIAMVSDLGLSAATVQRQALSLSQVHNMFWANVLFGFLAWVFCIVSAPALVAFYDEPRLAPVVIVLGSNFALGGLAVQPNALLRRRMQFRQIAILGLANSAATGLLGAVLAVAGLGYWALVWPSIVGSILHLAGALWLTGYRPGLPVRNVGARALLSFGGLLTLNGIVVYLSRNMDNVLIGRFWGAAELGYYTRAYFLMALPTLLVTSVLGQVMLPTLASVQLDRDRFGDVYRRALELSAFVGCPLAAGLGLVAPESIRLVYGSDWDGVVPILQWLSVAAVLEPIYSTHGWLFTAVGRGRPFLLVSVANAALLVTAFAAGVQWGAVGVARAYVFVFVGLSVWGVLGVAHRVAGLSIGSSLRRIVLPIVATGVMAVAVLAAGRLLEGAGVSWRLAFACKTLVGIGVYSLLTRRLIIALLRGELAHLVAPIARGGRQAPWRLSK